MITGSRDSRQTKQSYWDECVTYLMGEIRRKFEVDALPGGDELYRPQYIFEIAKDHLQLICYRYSRGDAVSDIGEHFPGILDSWEMAERLGKDVWSSEQQITRHSWRLNLDHYIFCFWLVGLALVFDVPDEQWSRLLVLVGNEGQDAVLDRVIASRQKNRRIGNDLCFPKTYQKLLMTVDGPAERQSMLLKDFVSHWYSSLSDAGNPDWPAAHRRPYWYYYGDQNLDGGAYFGRWCIEGVAAVKAFGIDDNLCLDQVNYPGDLLMDGRCPRFLDGSPDKTVQEAGTPPAKNGWLRGLFGKR